MVTVPDACNLGGNLTGTVLLLTLLRIACWGCGEKGQLNLGSTALLACTAAALCAIKTTFLLYAALFLVFWYASRLWHSPRLSIVREICLVGILTLALLAPWMWQQYRSCGTPLYPLLGNGYHAVTFGSALFGESLKHKAFYVVLFLFDLPAVPFVLAVVLMACDPWEDRRRWRLFAAAAFSAMVASIVFAFQIANVSALRYVHPMHYAILIPLGLYGFFRRRSAMAGAGLAVCLAIFMGTKWDNLRTLKRMPDFLARGERTLVVTPTVPKIREAQATIPPGTQILASIQDGYLLDFAHNPTWSLDNIAMTSLPPGLPVTSDPAALRDFIMRRRDTLPPPSPTGQVLDYLRHSGVDYLLFQRGPRSTWYLKQNLKYDFPFVFRVYVSTAMVFHQTLLDMMEHCPILYDDGDVVVLDLRSSSQEKTPVAAR